MTLSIDIEFPIRDRSITGLTTVKGTENPNIHGAIRRVTTVIGRYQRHHHHHCRWEKYTQGEAVVE